MSDKHLDFIIPPGCVGGRIINVRHLLTAKEIIDNPDKSDFSALVEQKLRNFGFVEYKQLAVTSDLDA